MSDQPTSEILSMDNPAGLSRMEYRVCVLLSDGVALERIHQELAISRSTLRTHLRNVCAKTEFKKLDELLAVLAPTESREGNWANP